VRRWGGERGIETVLMTLWEMGCCIAGSHTGIFEQIASEHFTAFKIQALILEHLSGIKFRFFARYSG